MGMTTHFMVLTATTSVACGYRESALTSPKMSPCWRNA